jgi:hypothetical protein
MAVIVWLVPRVRTCVPAVQFVGLVVSENTRAFSTAYQALPLYRATLTGLAGRVTKPVSVPALHAGAAGLLISIVPKKYPPASLNPWWVTTIVPPISAITGGIQVPEVGGEAGVLAALTPVTVMNAPDGTS